jgi:hypothetical protein
MAKAKKTKEDKIEEVKESLPIEQTETTPPVIVDTVEVNGQTVELINAVISEETLEAAPELKEEGLKVGDVIQVAATDEGDAKLIELVETQPELFGSDGDDEEVSNVIDEGDFCADEIEQEELSFDAARWERYLKGMGLTPEKFLETRPLNHPHRHHIEEIVSKKKK